MLQGRFAGRPVRFRAIQIGVARSYTAQCFQFIYFGLALRGASMTFDRHGVFCSVGERESDREGGGVQKSITSRMTDYLSDASLENFLCLRSAFAESPDYNPGNDDELILQDLLENRNYEKAMTFIQLVLPKWLCSPRMYMYSAFVYEKLGKSEDAQDHYLLGSSLLDSILATGDGSESKPYLVLYVADEYEVLTKLGKTMKRQRLVRRDGGKAFDVLACDDGSEIWFDITLLQKRGYLNPSG